jgi:hypothetical protein
VVSDKKIFKISANENTLWTLAAMLDFKSAPSHDLTLEITTRCLIFFSGNLSEEESKLVMYTVIL